MNRAWRESLKDANSKAFKDSKFRNSETESNCQNSGAPKQPASPKAAVSSYTAAVAGGGNDFLLSGVVQRRNSTSNTMRRMNSITSIARSPLEEGPDSDDFDDDGNTITLSPDKRQLKAKRREALAAYLIK